MGDKPAVRAPRHFTRPWLRSQRPVPRLLVRPVERFLRQETGSASLLMAAAVAALVWANVAPDSYDRLWSATVAFEVGPLELDEDVREVVNELLMAVFFCVVALEVKREVVFGSLRERRTAAVPVAAALGTMAGAAIAYLAVNLGGGEPGGWAIPIATDIAFALGVLGLVGRRAPRELRAFLLTLAVVDDLATILVIAVFYSQGISLPWLGTALVVAAGMILARRLGVRSLAPYVVLAGLLWLAVFESGVHATIAGVVIGFLTPAFAFHAPRETGDVIGEQLTQITRSDAEADEHTMWETSRLAREAVSPLTRLEHQLHPWSAFVILPLFALANAGVPVSLDGIADALTGRVGLGIFLGLVVGAPLVGLLLPWLLIRAGAGRMPDGLDWSALAGLAPLKGIGFTVAIFITVLALDDPGLQEQAKLAILIASLTAAIIGFAGLSARHVVRGTRRNA